MEAGAARRSVIRSMGAWCLGLALLVASPDGAETVRAGTATCTDGWRQPGTATGAMLFDVHRADPTTLVAVGSEPLANGKRRYVSWWQDASGATTMLGPAGTKRDSVLIAVAGTLPRDVWAVGYRQIREHIDPLAVRWVDGAWVDRSPVPSDTGSALLSAVDLDPTGGVWAAGTRVSDRTVRTALVLHGEKAGWTVAPGLHAPSGTALTGLVALAPDDVWAVGTRTGPRGTRPLILHLNGGTWETSVLDLAGPDAQLTAIAGTAADDLWAVGWRTNPGGFRPLVLHRDASGWSVVDAPALGGEGALLTDVSLDSQGRPWVVGGTYREHGDQYETATARRVGDGWIIYPALPDLRYLQAVTDRPVDGGATVGKARLESVVTGPCERAPGAARRQRQRRDARGSRAGGAVTRVPGVKGDEVVPRPVRGLPRVPAITEGPMPADLPGVRAVDVTARVGLTLMTTTHGASVSDLDGDGRDDLFISGHGGPPLVWLRVKGGYERQPVGLFRSVDRHDCAIGRIDAGPLPDIVCTVGGGRGVGFKANEIWLDPGTGVAHETGAPRGVADPGGRGRALALFDADGDGDLDLLLGSTGLRYDGLPSPNRLMRNDGDGRFTWDPASGLTSDLGAWCARPRDLDGDGDKDVLLCAMRGGKDGAGRVVVYRNDGGRFVDVTRSLGVHSLGEVDAELADLGGSARPDLIQLSQERIRISLWSHGRYVTAWERSVTRARNVAVGDVNGDGARDIFLLRGQHGQNDPDLLLVNDGTGRSWTVVTMPPVAGGAPDRVVPLDHDENGLTDFLVLNGSNSKGPLQLVAFYRDGERPAP